MFYYYNILLPFFYYIVSATTVGIYILLFLITSYARTIILYTRYLALLYIPRYI